MILFSRILSKRLHMNPTRAVLDLTSKQLQPHTFYSWETQHAWRQLQTAPHFLLWWLHFLLLWSGDVPLLLSPPTKAAWRSHMFSCSPWLGFQGLQPFQFHTTLRVTVKNNLHLHKGWVSLCAEVFVFKRMILTTVLLTAPNMHSDEL